MYASETDKRDFVIQIASQGTSNMYVSFSLLFLLIHSSFDSMSLQAETAIDFSTWLQALRSWNPHQVKTSSGNTRKILQHTSSSTAGAANKRVAVCVLT